MSIQEENPELFFYVRWEIREFRSVENFSDYKKIKARLLRNLDAGSGADAPRRRMRVWSSLVFNKYSVPIMVVSSVALVILGVLTLIVKPL